MGDYNKIEGIYEIPLPHLEDGKEQSVKLRFRVRGLVKAEFEDWLEAYARRRVFDQRDTMNVQEFRESMDAVARLCAAHTFAWNGDACTHALNQTPGMVKFFMLLMRDADRLLERNPDYEGPQKYTEADMIRLLSDPVIGVEFAQAIREIRNSDPNFRSPPIRGVED